MWKSGTAVGYIDLLDQLDAYIADQGSAFGIHFDPGNVGSGRVISCSGGPASVAETFTLECQADDSWTITGSVTGLIGSVNPGTPFTSTHLCIDLDSGDPEYAAGDTMTICTAPPWVRLSAKCQASSTRWRVRALNVEGSSSLTTCVGKLQMYETRGGTDQCTGGTASASSVASTDYNGVHTADMAFDTNAATFWQCLGEEASWLEYQFATAKSIVQVALTPGSAINWNNMPRNMVVEYYHSASGTWRIAGSWYYNVGAGVEQRTFDLWEYIWQGPGNDGNASVIVGVNPFGNPSTGAWNWRLNGYTGHSGDTCDWFNHPGAIARGTQSYGPVLPLADDGVNPIIEFWFYVNGRRIVVIAHIGSTYQAAYLGLILPFGNPGSAESPGVWPYPLAVGGSLAFDAEPEDGASAQWLYSYGGATNLWCHSAFPISRQNTYGAITDSLGKLRVRDAGGNWRGFGGTNETWHLGACMENKIWPFANGFDNMKLNLDGSVCLMPVMLYRTAVPKEVYGVLDGVFAIPGDGVGAESLILHDRAQYQAFIDVFRSDANSFFAVKED